MGGPDGGDGGKGGDVIIRGDSNLATLLDFTYRDSWEAERGQHGRGSNKTGASGDDVILPVPPGTIMRDHDTGEIIGEVLESGDEIVVAQGRPRREGQRLVRHRPTHPVAARVAAGRGRRDAHAGARAQAHRRRRARRASRTPGKSTLLSVITAARPKIADYPFTTLAPNLGVVQLSDHRTFVVADIPGIIEGAHEGKGLGLQFLRHIERTRLLAFLIPIDADGLAGGVRPAALARSRRTRRSWRQKPHCVVFTKMDLLGEDERAADRGARRVRHLRDQRGGAHGARGAQARVVARACST